MKGNEEKVMENANRDGIAEEKLDSVTGGYVNYEQNKNDSYDGLTEGQKDKKAEKEMSQAEQEAEAALAALLQQTEN